MEKPLSFVRPNELDISMKALQENQVRGFDLVIFMAVSFSQSLPIFIRAVNICCFPSLYLWTTTNLYPYSLMKLIKSYIKFSMYFQLQDT